MLSKLYADDSHKDVTFRLDDGSIVKAHRCLLVASGSSFFTRLLDPTSKFCDAQAAEIPIRECSAAEFKFVMLSVYELDDEVRGIEPADVFRLSARFDVSYRLSKFFARKDSDRHLSNRELTKLAFEYRPLFDERIIKLEIDVHFLLSDWSDSRSKYSMKLLTYLVSITPKNRNNLSSRLTDWLCQRTWPEQIFHIDLLEQHKDLLEAILRKWDPIKAWKGTLLKLVSMGYLNGDEVAKLIDYVKHKDYCYVISAYPLKVGYIHKSEDPPKGEFVCYYDVYMEKRVDAITSPGRQFAVYRQ